MMLGPLPLWIKLQSSPSVTSLISWCPFAICQWLRTNASKRGASAPLRAMLDTNVLYSHTRQITLVGLVRFGRFEAIWSSWIVAGLNRVLTWRWAEQYGAESVTDGHWPEKR